MAELEPSTAAPPQQDVYLLPARFNERFLAYFLDAFPFGAGYVATLQFGLPALGGPTMRKPVSLAFLGAYLLYQIIANAAGGGFGKRLMGLRVVRTDGRPLGLVRSVLRAFGYLLSTPLFNFGFMLALFHPENRALHDLLSGSVVIEPRRKGAESAAVSFLAAAALMTLLYGGIFWVNLYKPRPQDLQAVEDAKKGLEIMAQIEEAYRKDHGGVYTDKLDDLAAASGDANQFRLAMNELFDAKRGFRMQAGNRGYRIEGAARDLWGTRLIVDGPPPRVRQVKK